MADYRHNVVANVLPLCANSSSAALISCHQLFGLKKPGALQDLIGQINSGLNSSKKRLESLGLLGYMIEQCSASVFSSHCQTWLNLLLQCLQSHTAPLVQQHTMRVLSLVIERVSDFPELAREVGSTYIAQLLPVLLSPKSKKVGVAASTCINTCILYFPGPSGPFKGRIEAFVTEQLNRPTCSGVILRSYALLARCGTSGSQGIKHREGWSLQCGKLLSTMNSILAQLYDGLESGQEPGEDVVFSSRLLPDCQPDKVSTLVCRFQALCSCLETLMREPFPTWIQMPVEDILDSVCRALEVQLSMLTNSVSSDRLLLLSYLPFLHCAALKVLHRLIICCKKLLLPQGSVIFRLCVQCLAATHTQASEPGQDKPFSKLRESAYAVLSVWLQIVGSACQGVIDDEQDDILKEIFHDVQPQSDTLKIESKNVAAGDFNPPPAKRKKKGRSGYQELSQSGSSLWARRRHANSNLTVSALKVLELLVTFAGSSLNSQAFQMVQQQVGVLVLSVIKNQPPPFTSSVCRQALYQTLLATVFIPRPDVPSFLQGALALFQQGRLDSDFQVAHTCQEAILRLSNLVHVTTPQVRTPAFTGNVGNTDAAQVTPSSASKASVVSDNYSTISSSSPADVPTRPAASMVSPSSNALQPTSLQQAETPTSTSAIETSSLFQPSTSSGASSSNKGIDSPVSSSLGRSLEKTSRKRRQSANSASSESERRTVASLPVGKNCTESEDEEESVEESDDGVNESEMMTASSSVTAPGDAHTEQGDVAAQTSTASSGKGKGRGKGKAAVRDLDDGAISSSSSDQPKQEQNDNVQAMLMSFVDVGPDSD